jgi:aldose 1-epimerase
MRGAFIRSVRSEATVSLDGARVESIYLDGNAVVTHSDDGVPTHGGVAVLMPFAGRVRNGRYIFEGTTYQLPVSRDGHALHGFAKDARWVVASKNAHAVTLRSRLKSSGYPGILDARITYSIRPRSFSTECVVTNVAARNCPFVAGFHTNFHARNWRIETTGLVHRYALADRYFPTGKTETFSFEEVSPGTRLDDCFKVAGTIRLKDESSTFLITRKGMPYLVVYNGTTRNSSVAIEPYTGLDDAYNNGIGLSVLRPGQSFRCGYKISLSRSSNGPIGVRT